MAAKKRAFVISPIGGFNDDGTPNPRRANADLVFDKIIARAIELLGERGIAVEAVRNDHDPELAQIMESVIRGITSDELVICCMTDHDPAAYNANVFYELGIAHAAGRPTYLLKHREQSVPFDLTNEKYIEYQNEHLNGERDPADAAGPARLLADQIAAQVSKNEFYRKPFNRDLVLGRQGALDRFNSIKFDVWSSEILNAEKEVWLAGTTLWDFINPANNRFLMPEEETGRLSRTAHILDLFANRLSHGVNVTVLYAAPDHPLVEYLINRKNFRSPSAFRAHVESVRADIVKSRDAWRAAQVTLAAAIAKLRELGAAPDVAPGQFKVVEVKRGAVLSRVCLTDKRAFFTPNMYSIAYNTGPCVDARGEAAGGAETRSKEAYADASWHATLRDDLVLLRDINDPDAIAADEALEAEERAAAEAQAVAGSGETPARTKRRGFFGFGRRD